MEELERRVDDAPGEPVEVGRGRRREEPAADDRAAEQGGRVEPTELAEGPFDEGRRETGLVIGAELLGRADGDAGAGGLAAFDEPVGRGPEHQIVAVTREPDGQLRADV